MSVRQQPIPLKFIPWSSNVRKVSSLSSDSTHLVQLWLLPDEWSVDVVRYKLMYRGLSVHGQIDVLRERLNEYLFVKCARVLGYAKFVHRVIVDNTVRHCLLVPEAQRGYLAKCLREAKRESIRCIAANRLLQLRASNGRVCCRLNSLPSQ